ncbi:unnamed protein product [Darwinula stevensoni]|uniref:EGF-like domain-containing protein n=1 Tax=Darwinula stevensoni TaxID=69355 RepID=A0A7R9A6H3_9CRUS|nr:unnamed protein product [Darwinula stevensoni]CAG0889176.1 unnamed protein product [Darwinula stevensoni]
MGTELIEEAGAEVVRVKVELLAHLGDGAISLSTTASTELPEAECTPWENFHAIGCNWSKKEICAKKCGSFSRVCPPGFARMKLTATCEEVVVHSSNFTLEGTFDPKDYNTDDPDCEEGQKIQEMISFIKATLKTLRCDRLGCLEQVIRAAEKADLGDEYMDMDIRGINTFPISSYRKGALKNQLKIVGFMQFPAQKYNGTQAHDLLAILNDSKKWKEILTEFESSGTIPSDLDLDAVISTDINYEPERIPCAKETCSSYATCIEHLNGKPPTCECQERFRGLSPDIIGKFLEKVILGLVFGLLVLISCVFLVVFSTRRQIARKREKYAMKENAKKTWNDPYRRETDNPAYERGGIPRIHPSNPRPPQFYFSPERPQAMYSNPVRQERPLYLMGTRPSFLILLAILWICPWGMLLISTAEELDVVEVSGGCGRWLKWLPSRSQPCSRDAKSGELEKQLHRSLALNVFNTG